MFWFHREFSHARPPIKSPVRIIWPPESPSEWRDKLFSDFKSLRSTEMCSAQCARAASQLQLLFMRSCPYLNFRELPCLRMFWWRFLLMRWMKDQNNSGVCVDVRRNTKWMKCVGICACQPGKNKIKVIVKGVGVYVSACVRVRVRVWVSEWEEPCVENGLLRVGRGETSHLQPWQALTFIACSLSFTPPFLALTLAFLSLPPFFFRLQSLPCDRSTGSFQTQPGRLTVLRTEQGAALSALMLVTGRLTWRSKASGASMQMQIRHC